MPGVQPEATPKPGQPTADKPCGGKSWNEQEYVEEKPPKPVVPPWNGRLSDDELRRRTRLALFLAEDRFSRRPYCKGSQCNNLVYEAYNEAGLPLKESFRDTRADHNFLKSGQVEVIDRKQARDGDIVILFDDKGNPFHAALYDTHQKGNNIFTTKGSPNDFGRLPGHDNVDYPGWHAAEVKIYRWKKEQ